MKKKKGFTLVELLAVIVILAVILVIAVPKIMDTIKNSKEGTLMSSAKLIANQAEKKYIENQTLGITDKIECDDIVKTTDDYESCRIKFDEDGKASVTISGKGKFEGMAVCNATKTEASISNGCYTDEACFAYRETIDFDIDEDACKTFFIADGTPAEVYELICTGGAYNGISLAGAIGQGGYSIEDLEDAGVITNVVYGDEIEITEYDFSCGVNVSVPNKIDNKTVIAIGDYAFQITEEAYNNVNDNVMLLNNVKKDLNITKIEQAAEEDIIGIASIKLPNTIKYIGEEAFINNSLSGELDFSNLTNLIEIGGFAFRGNQITSIILPSSILNVGYRAFYRNPLKNVYLGNTDALVGCEAFGDLDELETHNLPNDFEYQGCK